MTVVRKHWPLIATIVAFWVVLAGLLVLSMQRNDGHLVYPLDDTYIHMAMAKNLVQHGVWGATRYAFGSSTSSPLWTLMLSAACFLFGASQFTPLVLNALVATALLVSFYLFLKGQGLSNGYVFFTLAGLIAFCAPHVIVFIGMEHTLHILLALVFTYLSARLLAEESPTIPERICLLTVAPFLVATRYEGVFMVGIVCLLLLLRKRLLYAIALGLCAALPIVIYGLVSVGQGWLFLPNSVLLKSAFVGPFSSKDILPFFILAYLRLANTPDLLCLVCLGAALLFYRYTRSGSIWSQATIALIIFASTSMLQTFFASIGRFYRYEAYLVVLGFVIGAVILARYLSETRPTVLRERSVVNCLAALLLVFLLPAPFFSRAYGTRRVLPATRNIYQQQVQIGHFLQRFYQGESVAINDIGAINYFADIRCFDVWGLATMEVAGVKRAGIDGRIGDLADAQGVKIAVVYDKWFSDGVTSWVGVPLQWTRVGQWTIADNIVCGDDTVSFYAVDPSEEDDLIANLRQFASDLPSAVMQSGVYKE